MGARETFVRTCFPLLVPVLTVALSACSGGEQNVVVADSMPKSAIEPMENPTKEKLEERIKLAGDLVVKYVSKHGGVFPKCESTKRLLELLKPEFGKEPGFAEAFISQNGRTYFNYEHSIQGKKIMDFPQKKQTTVLWNSLNLGRDGQCFYQLDGSIMWEYREPKIGQG